MFVLSPPRALRSLLCVCCRLERGSAQRRDLSESVVTDDVGEINAKVNPKGTKATSPANKNEGEVAYVKM